MKKRNKKFIKLMGDVFKKYIDDPWREVQVAHRKKKYVQRRGVIWNQRDS